MSHNDSGSLGRLERGERRRNSIGGLGGASFPSPDHMDDSSFGAVRPSHRREASEGGALRSRLSLDSTWSELQPLEENGASTSNAETPTSAFGHFGKSSPLDGLLLRQFPPERRRDSFDLSSPEFAARLTRRESGEAGTPPPELGAGGGRQAVKRSRSSVSIQVPPELLAQITPPPSSYPSPAMMGASPPGASPSPEAKERTRKLWLMVICAGGIYTCYITYGIQQEKLYTTDYSEGLGEYFEYTLVLVFVQCIFNVLFSLIIMLAQGFDPRASQHRTKVKVFTDFAPTSFAYISATICSNAALQYLSYPTQVLGKSVKMIPVMLFGVFYNRIRYKWSEYFCVLLVSGGIGLFFLSNKVKEGDEEGSHSVKGQLLGQLLLIASLVLDGVTGATQDRMVAKHLPSSLELMFFQNLWGAILTFFALLSSGELFGGVAYLLRYRVVLLDVTVFSLTSAAGQFFIFLCIRHFDALFCATVTTTRKFFTILASVVWYGHHLTSSHWLGVLMVFGGLLGKIYGQSGGGASKLQPAAVALRKSRKSDPLSRAQSAAPGALTTPEFLRKYKSLADPKS